MNKRYLFYLLIACACLLSAKEATDQEEPPQKSPTQMDKPVCFLIEQIEFMPLGIQEDDTKKILKKFSYIHSISKPFLNTCMGIDKINELIKKLNFKTIQKGYMTTKFGLLPQNLSKGVLRLGIEVGFVGDIEYANNGKMFFFGKDFGVKNGDILDLETLELGISNLKRMRHLAPKIQILPSSQTSKSNIIITTNPKSLPFFLQASFDNGGTLANSYEWSFLLGIENPLRLADSLQLYFLGSIPMSKKNHSYYGSLSYSVPIRRFLIQIDSSYSHNAQEIKFASITPVYSGNSINSDLKVSYLAYANANQQVSLGLGIAERMSDNYLDTIKLDIQKKRLSEISAFVSYKRFFSQSQSSIILSLLQGVPLFGSNKNYMGQTYLYTIPNLNIYLYTPFDIFKQIFVYSSTLKTQISRNQLYASEKMTIGGRYTVRGFDHFNLSGQVGVLYRNDLMIYLPKFWWVALAPSFAADMGYVRDLDKKDNNTNGFLSGGGVGLQAFYKYFNAQIWGYFPFYNPYNASTQSLFFSIGANW